jgi:hypothetical protein
MQITREVAEKVLSVVNAGLVNGLGEAKPGNMCVEAAVCYALDLPHGDRPLTCVGSAVNSFAIRLNDARWPSDKDRTDGMRKFSIAHLGSASIDQTAFSRLVIDGVRRKIVPMALRCAGEFNPDLKEDLENAAVACETAVDRDELCAVVAKGRDLAYKVRAYAADAYAAYAAAAAYAADAAYAAAYAADAAYAYAYAYAADAAYAAAYRLKVLQATAQIGVDALIELQSPGCEYLDLCE